MRLLVCDADPELAKLALSGVHVPGASVLLNPAYLSPDPSDTLWIACGAPALKLVQSAGWLPKKGGVESNRGSLSTVQPDGWQVPIHVGVTYSPLVRHVDPTNFVDFMTDLRLYRRFEETGSMAPVLGKYAWVRSFTGVLDYIERKHGATGSPVEVCLDTETMGLHPWYPDKKLISVSLTAMEGLADVVYLPDLTEAERALVRKQVEWVVTTPKVRLVGANLKYDMLWLRVKWGIVVSNFAFDTCNGGSLCDENRSNSLNVHTKVYAPLLGGYDDSFNRRYDKGHMERVPKGDLLPYAGGDTDAGLRVFRAVREELLRDNLTPSGKPAKNSIASLYVNVVHKALKAIHHMEYQGVHVDLDKFHAFGADLAGKIAETKQMALSLLPSAVLAKHGGPDDSGGAPLSRPALMADALFSPLGLNLTPVQTTEKTGRPSITEYHLNHFKDHPEAGPLIQNYLVFQQVAKMHGTYYQGFLKHLRPDGRWHPTYIIHKQGGRDSDGPAGTVCVTADTLFHTSRGVIPYSDLEVGDQVITHEGVPRPIVRLVDNGMQPILAVKTAEGLCLSCTYNHPFLTPSGWKEAEHLSNGEKVAALCGPEVWKAVPGWPLHVSSWGRVRSWNGAALAPRFTSPSGYLAVMAEWDCPAGGTYPVFWVHALVASAFVDGAPCPSPVGDWSEEPSGDPDDTIGHGNGIPWDNSAGNLFLRSAGDSRPPSERHGGLAPAFHWQEVVSVTSEGAARTYGATVAAFPSHVTNGLVTHNTGRGSASDPAFQCVSGDTEILTRDGLFTAAEIIDPSGVTDSETMVRRELEIWTSEGWRHTSIFFRSWRGDRIRVRLAGGVELTCTPEQPFLVYKGRSNNSRPAWVLARDLKYHHTLVPTGQIARMPPPLPVPDAAGVLFGITLGAGVFVRGASPDSPVASPGAVEWPSLHADAIRDGLRACGMAPTVEIMEETAVYLLPRRQDWTPLFREIMNAILPHDRMESRVFPRKFRATTAIPSILRGLHHAGGGEASPAGRVLTTRFPSEAVARAVQMEMILDGGIPSFLRFRGGEWSLQWRRTAITRALRFMGMADAGDAPDPRCPSDVAFMVSDLSWTTAGYVYDFTVPDTSSFVANGLVIHNTVPKHSYWGKRLRECIIAPPGHVIVGCDYSQGELKVTACWAGEAQMIRAYQNGIDLHLLTAATVNGMSYEEALNLKTVNPETYAALRQNGKAGNFGLLYGMTAYGFMLYADAVYGVKLTLEEAEAMRDSFFDLYPGLVLWHQRQIAEAEKFGYVRSPLGRVRHLPTIHSPIEKVRKHARAQSINSSIQGTLSDMMWWAMGIIEEERAGRLPPFGNVHDQGLWYVPEDGWEDDARYIRDTMENLPFEEKFGWRPDLKFTVDTEIGTSLADLEKKKL